VESYPYPVKEGQRYINLNPGRWGSEWTREEKRQERGYPGPMRHLCHVL